MIILSCRHLTKSFGIDEILRDVTFNINEGDKVGLIGPNGEGKSTLFKILTKQLDYDSGELFLDKNKTLGYLSQNLSLDSENTIYDEMLSVFSSLTELEDKIKTLEEKLNEPYDASNEEYHNKLIKDYTLSQELYENRGGYTFRGEISRVLKGLGFLEEDFNNQIINLSGGQKTRLALCKLLLRKPDLLLLDEPTNHLDLEAIEWLEEYLNGYKGTVFVISHDRFFLDSVTNTTFELIGGKIHCYNASYTKFLELRKKDIEARLKAYNLQQAEIKRQEEIIEKFRSFNREKSVRAAESRQKALDKMDRLEAPEALIGENGRGKTTLFKIIMGMLKQDSGSVSLGKNVFTGYYDQEQSNLNLHKTIIDEVWDDFPNLTTTEVRNYLASFLFTGDDVFKEISLLSGGEKCKINLLKLMLSKANLLLLDEPTNHLDIMSREALEDAILSYDGTLIVISHDRYFLNKVINKIVELQENGLKTYLGNYNYYMHKKANPNRYEDIDEEINQGKTKTQIKEERKKKKSAEKSARALRAQLREVEKLIPQKEEELEKLQGMLCTEEVYSNPEESVRVNKEINSVQEEIDSLYATWEELSESLEE